MALESATSHDTSRWSHGWVYHTFFDRPLEEARRVVADLVPEGARVLDIACGTGKLCCLLRAAKGCRVVGVELSDRMLRFARAHSQHEDVAFVRGDATDLRETRSSEYDYATMLFLIHELPPEQRVRALEEALRVARRVVVVDSHVPLPRNAHAAALHVVEWMGGREHHASFADYLAAGGIMGAVARLQTQPAVLHRSAFWHGCRDAVVLSRHDESAEATRHSKSETT
jgi:SAM-dependent methyltransferase